MQGRDGPPDLVVEVISPESVGGDRGEKFHEYEGAGIAEYWLVDPQREVLEVYVLDDGERYIWLSWIARESTGAGFWMGSG